ncbi:MAG: hypothetical protein LBG48_01435 [Rickettsiales bacterium]|nr:hypothetical protein [Rickettsiales bacterium]
MIKNLKIKSIFLYFKQVKDFCVMKLAKYLVLLLMLVFLQSCVNTKVIDVKSPCVSADGGPCGPRKPVNTWLLKEYV